MSEAKFSNGPWKIDESYQSMLLITDSLGSAVAEVDSAGFYSGVYNEWTVSPTDTQKANAHLISAAPEMYAALNAIDFDDGMISESLGCEFKELVIRALAKARGEA